MNKKKIPVLSVALYTLTGLLVLYTIWAAVYSFGYISKMVTQNQLIISGNEFEIASFYMSNFAQYALLAVILFALGRILQIYSSGIVGNLDTENQVPSSREISDDESDEDDFEEWFQNNTKKL